MTITILIARGGGFGLVWVWVWFWFGLGFGFGVRDGLEEAREVSADGVRGEGSGAEFGEEEGEDGVFPPSAPVHLEESLRQAFQKALSKVRPLRWPRGV